MIKSGIHGSINYGNSSRSKRTLSLLCLTAGIMFFLGCFFLVSPQNTLPKVLEIIQMFFGKCEASLCALFPCVDNGSHHVFFGDLKPLMVVKSTIWFILESKNTLTSSNKSDKTKGGRSIISPIPRDPL